MLKSYQVSLPTCGRITSGPGLTAALSGAHQLTSGKLPLNINLRGAVHGDLGNGFAVNLSSAVVGGGVVTYYTSPYN